MKKELINERKKLLVSLDNLLEGPMIFLGFAWLVLLVIELVWSLPRILELISVTIWIVFIIDFILKLILAPDKVEYFKTNWLTAVSLIVPALRIFRIFKAFRVLRGLRGVRLLRIVSSLNRSIQSLGASMKRRGFSYVLLLTVVVTFAGAAGMYGLEAGHQGFENYGMALWWTSMRVITAGSDFWPVTPEGRGLAFILSLFGYAIFGYVTATLATFFIGRDAEEANAPVAGAKDIEELKQSMITLQKSLDNLQAKSRN